MGSKERLAWLKERQSGLGGSDIAAIFGKCPFERDKYGLYHDKVRELTMGDVTEPAGHMKTGIELEEPTLRDYEKLKGVRVARGGYSIRRHKDYPFLLASLDGFDEVNKVVVEVKVVSNKARQDRWLDGKGGYRLPLECKLQVAHYCSVMDVDRADVIVRFQPSCKEVVVTYERCRELEAVIVEKAMAFWEKHVVARVEPKIGASSCALALRDLVLGDDGGSSAQVAPEDIRSLVRDIVEMNRQAKSLDAQVKEKKARILQYCKDVNAYSLYDEGGGTELVSVSQRRGRVSFDSSSFRDEHGEIYAKYKKEGKPYNVLRLNAGEGE